MPTLKAKHSIDTTGDSLAVNEKSVEERRGTRLSLYAADRWSGTSGELVFFVGHLLVISTRAV